MNAIETDPWNYLTNLGVQHGNFESSFFQKGNQVCQPLKKVPYIISNEEDPLEREETFLVYKECHQSKKLEHTCKTCRQSFPSYHLLDLHISEMHDSFFHLAAKTKPMFKCFLEECDNSFMNEEERKDHCISIHKFPSDYRFSSSWRKISHNKNYKVKKPKNAKANNNLKNLTTELSNNDQMECSDSLTSSSSDMVGKNPKNAHKKTNKIPTNLCFGYGTGKTFIRSREKKKTTHWHQKGNNSLSETKVDIENVDMKELEAALS